MAHEDHSLSARTLEQIEETDRMEFLSITEALDKLRARAETRRNTLGTRHGRRWAILQSKVEDALLHAQEGYREVIGALRLS